MRKAGITLAFGLIIFCSLSSCISYTSTELLNADDIKQVRKKEGGFVRDHMRKSLLIRIALLTFTADSKSLNNGFGIPDSSLKETEVLLSKFVNDAITAAREATQTLPETMKVMQVVGDNAKIDVTQPPNLKLLLTDAGIPQLKVDAGSRTISVSMSVLRGIILAAIAETQSEKDLDVALADLADVKRLDRLGRANIIDVKAEEAYLRKELSKENNSDQSSESVAFKYLTALQNLKDLPDNIYFGRYQSSSGKVIEPIEIAWNLYADEAIENEIGDRVISMFLTAMLHEIGHVALKHPTVGVSCQRREMIELEADTYSAAVIAIARLQPKALLSASISDRIAMMEGGFLPSKEIESFFKMAYSFSGFDVNVSNNNPSSDCYPTVSQRSMLATAVNKAVSETYREAADELMEKCIKDELANHQEEDLKALEKDGEVSRSIDLKKCTSGHR